MTTLEIPMPDSVFAALRRAPREVAREMRIAAAIHWYQQATISMERAAEVADMGRAVRLTAVRMHGELPSKMSDSQVHLLNCGIRWWC